MALIAYGLIGIAIFVFVAQAINRPLERVRELSESVEDQRAALVESMDQAEQTIRQMAAAVGNMDTSLSDAKIATERSSTISGGLATSMFLLRDQMFVTIPIIEAQPFVGLAPGFDQTGQQLQQLSIDLSTIGTSLDTNRGDVVATSENLVDLARSVGDLTEALQAGPPVAITEDAVDSFRLAIFAIAGWVVLFAVACVLVGLYLIFSGRRAVREMEDDLA
ncbi:MAG TPA: hypothetical protein VMZ33_06480 [Candidatus Limnocylindrales bacterium]|nr:hypothetical protein [Candidatus Limnocylindrales bacterium]